MAKYPTELTQKNTQRAIQAANFGANGLPKSLSKTSDKVWPP